MAMPGEQLRCRTGRADLKREECGPLLLLLGLCVLHLSEQGSVHVQYRSFTAAALGLVVVFSVIVFLSQSFA